MGCDVSYIVKNDFRKVEDKKASIDYMRNTIAMLKEKLHIDNPEEDFEMTCPDDEGYEKEYFFYLPESLVCFYLHNGFWNIDSNIHQRIMLYNDVVRRRARELVSILGQKELWYAIDTYTNFGICEANPTITFEEWFAHAKEKFKEWLIEEDRNPDEGIPEFEIEFAKERDKWEFPAPLYHGTIE